MAETKIESFLAETTIPEQQNVDQTLFPAVLSPITDADVSVLTAVIKDHSSISYHCADVSVLTAVIKDHRSWFKWVLNKTGAVFLREFPVGTVSEFNNVIVEAFGFEELPYLGGADSRRNVVGRVFTANDSPPGRAAKLGKKLEWLEDGIKTVSAPVAGIKVDESRNRKIWFNSLVAIYTLCKYERNDPVKSVTSGDGTPLPADIIQDCIKILDEENVVIRWQKGDVLLLDNGAVLHSRRVFDPPPVLASFCK